MRCCARLILQRRTGGLLHVAGLLRLACQLLGRYTAHVHSYCAASHIALPGLPLPRLKLLRTYYQYNIYPIMCLMHLVHCIGTQICNTPPWDARRQISLEYILHYLEFFKLVSSSCPCLYDSPQISSVGQPWLDNQQPSGQSECSPP